ncbi:10515_t:CDS:1, partial [Racocetra persica]
AVTFSHVFIPPSISHNQFAKLFSHLKSTNKLPFIHKFTFNNSQIKAEDIISVLENCENLQELYILGCKEVKLLSITTAMKNLYQENENLEDKKIMVKKRLQKLKKIVLTRCVGGKRHSFTIKQILEDLQILKKYQQQQEKGRRINNCNNCYNENQNNAYGKSYNIDTISTISATMSNMMPAVLMSNSVNIYTNVNLTTNPIECNKNNNEKNDANDGIFQFQSCSDLSCELCTLKCAGCNTKYKYWDEFWIKCGWCKDRHFCGGCVIEASKKNVFKTYAFQFMRIKLCQMFDLPCPH